MVKLKMVRKCDNFIVKLNKEKRHKSKKYFFINIFSFSSNNLINNKKIIIGKNLQVNQIHVQKFLKT